MKIKPLIFATALAWGMTVVPIAHSGPNPLIIEGSNYIGGCNVGLRKVDGAYHCPPDNPDGGRTPPGYFWDPASSAGYAMGQTVVPERTGAYIRIVQTGQHCSGSNMVFTYNNGDTVDQGYNSACVVVVSGVPGGGGSSGGGGSGGAGGGGAATGTLTDSQGVDVAGGDGTVSAGDASSSPGGGTDSSSDGGGSSGGD